MTSTVMAMPRMWAWEWHGWRLSLRMPPKAAAMDREQALAQFRMQQEAAAAGRDLERQWGSLLLDRQLLNG